MLAKLDAVIAEATAAFEGFDYARALERTESFFWWFCDDYVELVKGRGVRLARRQAATSARSAAAHRRSAPCSDCSPRSCRSSPRRRGAGGSDRQHPRPAVAEAGRGRRRPELIDAASARCSALVRRAKTEAKVSQRAEVATLRVTAAGGASTHRSRPQPPICWRPARSRRQVIAGDQLECDVALRRAP